MRWSTINFYKLTVLLLPTFLRKSKMKWLLVAVVKPLSTLYKGTLYKMQHDGRTIYLEKMLNELFVVAGYDANNHIATRTIYIEDALEQGKIFIYQDEESEVIFLEDDADVETDIFIENESENVFVYSWIIFIPIAYQYQELQLRAVVDDYRFIGKKYIIKTY